jgi:hypothetical protein
MQKAILDDPEPGVDSLEAFRKQLGKRLKI